MMSGWAASGNGLASIVWFSGTLLGIGGAAALLLPAIPVPRILPDKLPRSITRDWASLLQIRAFRLLLIIAALVEGSHALHDSFSVIRWRAAGDGLPVISGLWSESVLSEVLVFLLIGPRLIRLFAPGGAIALAAVAGVIRWTVAAFTTSPVILAFIQPLHGFTFALLHLAAMQVIAQVVPLRLAATAQAIYGTLCIGLATALLTLASGLLYGRMGGTAFLVMAALCRVGAAIMRSDCTYPLQVDRDVDVACPRVATVSRQPPLASSVPALGDVHRQPLRLVDRETGARATIVIASDGDQRLAGGIRDAPTNLADLTDG